MRERVFSILSISILIMSGFFVISIIVNFALLAFWLVDPTIGGQSIFAFEGGAQIKELLVVALGTFTHTHAFSLVAFQYSTSKYSLVIPSNVV